MFQNTNITTYFRHLIVNFNLETGVKQPDMTSKDRFYKVYSTLKFKLRLKDDIYLNLKFDIQTPETSEPWLNLLPSLNGFGLHIENDDWIQNKTKDNINSIAHTKQKIYSYDRHKKDQCIGFIFFLGEQVTDSITTKCNLK